MIEGLPQSRVIRYSNIVNICRKLVRHPGFRDDVILCDLPFVLFVLSTATMPLKHIHLPHELWFVIAQLLDRSTLKSLSLVSSTHRDAIQPALFSHLKLKCVNPGEIGTVEFLRRNEKLLKLALWVRRLDLVGPIINVSDHRVVLVDALASMRNLRSLSILDHPFQNETHFRETVEILKENCTSLTSVTFDVSSTEFAHNAQMALHGVERITWKDRDCKCS